MKSLRHFYRKGIPLISRGEGLFKLGEVFLDKGISWTIVEVVPYGMYPEEQPHLRVWGYYRQQESYVLRDEKGNCRWPLVGTLLKMEKVT